MDNSNEESNALRIKLLSDPKERDHLRDRRSPLPHRKSDKGGENASSSGSGKLRHVATAEAALHSTVDTSAATAGEDTSDGGEHYYVTGSNGGSGGSDITNDDLDITDGDGTSSGPAAIDPNRTKAAIGHLQIKIQRTMVMIKSEQDNKEENVNEYLRLSTNADKQQANRIKTLFEKKNQKSTQNIAALQRKLDSYQKRLREVELHGVTGHRQAKEVLKDVGQGIKDVGANIREGITGFSGGVVDNIRGAKESIVSKPKEFAHLIKNKFGSADNINAIKNLDDLHQHPHHQHHHTHDLGGDLDSQHSTGSVPPAAASSATTSTAAAGGGGGGGQTGVDSVPSASMFKTGNSMFYTSSSSYKYGGTAASDEDGGGSSAASEPGRTSPRPHSDSAALALGSKRPSSSSDHRHHHHHHTMPKAATMAGGLQSSSGGIGVGGSGGSPPAGAADLAEMVDDLMTVTLRLDSQQDDMMTLSEEINMLRKLTCDECTEMKQLLEEEQCRVERLEEAINDLTELHQHEVSNIKQELSSMEEKMEYQLEERTRDMQELLENCQTRITKMELQQQQQHLISMEGIENTNFRAVLTKLINVVLALLAVILVLVSTVAGFLGPFLTTRVRIVSTFILLVTAVLLWQNWTSLQYLVDYLPDVLTSR